MMDKVYVVTCRTEGCDECGPESHVVYVSFDEEKAKKARENHWENYEHIHYFYVDIQELSLDAEYHDFAVKKGEFSWA